jgi:CspA family cold shock protein
MPIGYIIKISTEQGFGFISLRDGSPDVFFHRTAAEPGQFEQFREGQGVSFDLDVDASTTDRRRAVKVVPCTAAQLGRTADPEPAARHPRARRRKPTWRQ